MARTLLIVTAATMVALLFTVWPQIGDPLIRHDDYPAFFLEEQFYYEKTLTEGRWLNYWWMSRDWTWSSNMTFLIYLLGWAVFSAAVALNALGREARLSFVILMAVLISLSPQAYLISAWFNTLTLAVWVIAGFAVASLYVSARTSRLLLLVFGPISMLAYTTYPLVMSAVLFTRHDTQRSLRDLFMVLVVLAVSIVLGMMLMYSLNYVAHGVFGLEISDWRRPENLQHESTLIENLSVLPQFFEGVFTSLGFGVPWLGATNVTFLLLALVVLARTHPGEALYIGVGIAATLGILLVHALQEGINVPMRAMIATWVFFAILLARTVAAQASSTRGPVLVGGLVIMAALFAGQLQRNTWLLVEWQQATRDMAAQVPDDIEAVVVYGHLWALPQAESARIAHYYGMTGRLRQLTGKLSVYCFDPYVECLYTPPFDPDQQDETMLFSRVNDVMFIRMPKVPEGAWKPLS